MKICPCGRKKRHVHYLNHVCSCGAEFSQTVSTLDSLELEPAACPECGETNGHETTEEL